MSVVLESYHHIIRETDYIIREMDKRLWVRESDMCRLFLNLTRKCIERGPRTPEVSTTIGVKMNRSERDSYFFA